MNHNFNFKYIMPNTVYQDHGYGLNLAFLIILNMMTCL